MGENFGTKSNLLRRKYVLGSTSSLLGLEELKLKCGKAKREIGIFTPIKILLVHNDERDARIYTTLNVNAFHDVLTSSVRTAR